jgi:hypothetical protein
VSRLVGIRVLDRAPGARCVLCLDELAGPISACAGCGAAWHVECKLEARQARCTTIGCPGGDVTHEVRAGAADSPPSVPTAARAAARAAEPAAERATGTPTGWRLAVRSAWRGGVAHLENGLRGAGVALALILCPAIYGWTAVVFLLPLTSVVLGLREQAVGPLAAAGAVGGFVFAAYVLSSTGIRLRDQAVILLAALTAAIAALLYAPRHELLETIVAGFFGAAALAGAWILPRPEDGAHPGS